MLEVIIAAVAGVLGAALGSWATMRAARTAERTALEAARITKEVREAEIEFVDVSLVEPEDLDEADRASLAPADGRGRGMAILDVKLRNSGGETAYIYELRLKPWDVRDGFRPELPGIVEDHETRSYPSRVGPSHHYQDRRENGHDPERPQRVSQALPPGEVDRFLVSVKTPACFFRANVSVTFNAGRTAEANNLKFLRKPPDWVDSDSMLELLRARLQECGPFAARGSRRMPAAEAGRLCLAEYEESLLAAAALYALAGRTSDPEYAAIHASRSRIPQMRQDLGLDHS
ncbi:hypothetical protein ACFW23_36915 [Streptomyces rochei]|uniref:hypothetical protein n=1 Tax=Streptomyces rochei TaxID=1928 RepID=UPI0036BAAA8C